MLKRRGSTIYKERMDWEKGEGRGRGKDIKKKESEREVSKEFLRREGRAFS
jgi:hypothetical protein